jgi:hypothetical protein
MKAASRDGEVGAPRDPTQIAPEHGRGAGKLPVVGKLGMDRMMLKKRPGRREAQLTPWYNSLMGTNLGRPYERGMKPG